MVHETIVKCPPFFYYYEADIFNLAPQILSNTEVLQIIAAERKRDRSQWKFHRKGDRAGEHVYIYTPNFLESMKIALAAAEKASVLQLVSGRNSNSKPLSVVARRFHVTTTTLKESLWPLGPGLMVVNGRKTLVHWQAFRLLEQMLVPDEELYAVHTGKSIGNGGRRIFPKPNLSIIEGNWHS